MKTLKKTLCLVLVLALTVSMFAVAASAASYSTYADKEAVAASKYAEAMDVAMGLGIINGVEGNKVAIDATLNRAMAAKILCYLTLGADASEALAAGATKFSDVAENHWANKYIAYAASQKWLTGSNGKFNPSAPVTGYQLGKMVLNAMGYGLSIVPVINNGVVSYTTVNEYEGDYWTTKISLKANELNLFAGLKGVDMNKALTRGQAMQIVFNAIATVGEIPAYSVTKDPSAANNDAYGRPGYTWINDATGKACAGVYTTAAAWTYTAASATTAANVAKAYATAAGIDVKLVVNTTAAKAGEIVEFAVAKDATTGVHTLTELRTISYNFFKVAKVEATKDKDVKYKTDITLAGYSTVMHDDKITLSLTKGDVIAVPGVDTLVWADAVKLEANTGKVTAMNSTNEYVIIGGAKLYIDELSVVLDETEALNFVDTYTYYVAPTGTLAAIETYVTAAPAYTTTVAYALRQQAVAYKAANAGSSDLLGTVTGDSKEVTAKHVIEVLNLDGTVSVLNVAVVYNKTADKYYYTGTDNMQEGAEVAAITLGAYDKFIEYYVDSNGDAVIVAETAPVATTTTKAGVMVGSNRATAATEITVVTKAVVSGKTVYASSKITGYKNFVAAEYATSYVVAKDGVVSAIYAVNVPAGEVLPVYTDYAAVVAKGDLTANGFAYTVVIGGETKTLYSAEDITVGGYYRFVLDGNKIKTIGTELSSTLALNDATIVATDAGYFVYGTNSVYEYQPTVKVFNISGKDLSVAKDTIVDVFEDTTNKITTIFIVGVKTTVEA